jgi:hypothetical protein
LQREIAIGVAQQLKDLKLPSTYINGAGGNGQAGLLETLIGAKMAESMIPQKNN